MPTDISVVINPPEQVNATLQTNPNQIDLTVNQFGDVPPHATTHAPNGSDSLGAYYITGDVVRPSETGSFITTGQTGQFATTGQLSFSNTEVITGDTTLAANKSYLVRIPPGSPSSTLNVYLPSNPQSGSFIELQTEFLESGWGFAKGLNINANGNLATGWQNEISWTGDFSIFAPLQAPLFADLVYNGSAWIYTYKGPDLSFGRIYYAGPGALLTVGSNYRISSVNSGIFAAASQTGQFITTGQTGRFVSTGSTGSFITSSQTGQFVWTGSTGNFITGSVVRPSETGSFLTTSQTGSFISASQTGGFVGTGQTGFYTGVFYPYSSNPNGYVQGAVVRPSQTGQFVGTGSTGSFISVSGGSHGDILYRGPSSWVLLPAGTSGQFLKTNGSGANPVWASIP
jgi:hypothetical protein